MEIRKLGEDLRSVLGGLVSRSVLDRRGSAETPRWQLKEGRKKKK